MDWLESNLSIFTSRFDISEILVDGLTFHFVLLSRMTGALPVFLKKISIFFSPAGSDVAAVVVVVVVVAVSPD